MPSPVSSDALALGEIELSTGQTNCGPNDGDKYHRLVAPVAMSIVGQTATGIDGNGVRPYSLRDSINHVRQVNGTKWMVRGSACIRN